MMENATRVVLHIIRHGDVPIMYTDGRKNAHKLDINISSAGRRQVWGLTDAALAGVKGELCSETGSKPIRISIDSSPAVRTLESAIQVAVRVPAHLRRSLLPKDVALHMVERRRQREREKGLDFLGISFSELQQKPLLRRSLEVIQEEIREELDALAMGVYPDERIADFLAPPIENEGAPLDIWQKDNKLKPIPEEALRRVLHYKQEVIAKMLEIAATTKKPAVRFIVTHENVAELLVASFSPNLSLPTLTVGEMNRFYHLARGEGFTVSLDAKGQPVDVRRIKPLFMYEAL